MWKIMLMLFAAACLTLPGCAKMPDRSEYVVMEKAPKVTAGKKQTLVYFLRESALGGAAVTYFIYEDEQKIGVLRSGSYFIHPAKIGKHTYWAETESKAKTVLTLEVRKGQPLYVLGGVTGLVEGRPSLAEITAPVARKLLPGLKYTRLSTPQEAVTYRQKEADSRQRERESRNLTR